MSEGIAYLIDSSADQKMQFSLRFGHFSTKKLQIIAYFGRGSKKGCLFYTSSINPYKQPSTMGPNGLPGNLAFLTEFLKINLWYTKGYIKALDTSIAHFSAKYITRMQKKGLGIYSHFSIFFCFSSREF